MKNITYILLFFLCFQSQQAEASLLRMKMFGFSFLQGADSDESSSNNQATMKVDEARSAFIKPIFPLYGPLLLSIEGRYIFKGEGVAQYSHSGLNITDAPIEYKGWDVRPGLMFVIPGCGQSLHVAGHYGLFGKGKIEFSGLGPSATVTADDYETKSYDFEIVAGFRIGSVGRLFFYARRNFFTYEKLETFEQTELNVEQDEFGIQLMFH